MRQDWVEFEGKNNNKVLLRPEYISSVIDESKTAGVTRIGYDEHPLLNGTKGLTTFCECAEPYEQVKQKIMDAEKIDLSNVVVEHFTREEYELLSECVDYHVGNGQIEPPEYKAKLVKLQNKLNEILKEDK